MMTLEIQPTKKEEIDLSPLGEMVGVKRALQQLVSTKEEVGEEEVGQILKVEQKKYVELGTKFRPKANDLAEIIDWFAEGRAGVDEILEGAGVVAEIQIEEGRGGILGGILEKLGRR